MPKRTGPEIELAIDDERRNRWRLMLRNPAFQQEVNALRAQYHIWLKGDLIGRLEFYDDPDSEDFDYEVLPIERDEFDLSSHDCCDLDDPMVGAEKGAWNRFNGKWDIELPHTALAEQFPDLASLTVDQWERLYEPDGTLIPSVLSTSEGFDPSDATSIHLSIDLRFPRDVLVERLNQELKRATHERSAAQADGKEPASIRRHHKKMDDQLNVYDQARRGVTFECIARSFVPPKALSTVKSAYIAIAHKIGGSAALAAKAEAPLVGFDPEDHCKRCPVCQTARTVDDLCAQAVSYMSQDHVGQRELTGLDTTRNLRVSDFSDD